MTNRSSGTETEELVTYLDMEAPQVRTGRSGQKRNRSITQFEGTVRDMVEEAANDVETITLFPDPLPDPHRSRVALETVLTNVGLRFQQDVNREGRIESYVSTYDE